MTAGQFAKVKGVTRQAVMAAIKTGRIKTTKDPKTGKVGIDSEKALEDWAANSKPSTRQSDLSKSAERSKTDEALYTSRAMREAYNARLAKLEFEEKSRTLVSVAEVKKSSFNTARVTRDAVLAIPDRIAHELASETDPHKCHTLLMKALVEALEELARSNGG